MRYLLVLSLFAAGCVFNDPRTGEDCSCHNLTECKPCPEPIWLRPKSESWDQENLKSQDNTCKTMVYHVDPATGLLEQCPPDAM